MSSQSGFGEKFIGTDTWIARVLGKFNQTDIQIGGIGEIQLHPEIQNSVKESWQKTLDLRRITLLSQAKKDGKIIDVFVKDEKPLPALYVKEADKENRMMFAGPSIALVKYEKDENKLKVVHGLTNYAVRTLMNTRPYSIIDKYGFQHFVDSINLSVLPTFFDESLGEVGQTFKRHGTNVNEYPGAIGTIAGGFASRNPKTDLTLMNPFHAIEKEMYEEGRLLPFLLDPREYTERGILHADSEINFDQLADGTRIAYVSTKGQTKVRALIFDEDKLICTGIATDINPFAKDPSGSIKQYFKSEYMFLCRTGIQRKHYNERDEDVLKGWPRNDEHVEAYYFPFTKEGISKYVMEYHPELMGPTSAVITYSLVDFENGKEKVMTLSREIGKHPLYSRIDSKINIPVIV